MTWIRTILPAEATGDLKDIYQKTQSPHGTVDNVYIAKSLRPQTILGHDTLYKSVLHHPDNVLPCEKCGTSICNLVIIQSSGNCYL